MRPMRRWGLGLGFVLACADDGASTTASTGGQGGASGSGGAESTTGGGGGLGSGGLGGGELDLDLYDPNRVIEIAIELEDNDFAALRSETRSLLGALVGEGCLAEPFASPYSFYSATVTVEGEVRANVGVRKKGFVGSLSTVRPSLKLDFGEFDPEQTLGGYERLTLNNSNQDPSLMRTCLTYGIFTSLSLPAPRCNFAHVVVNGEDLGLYANVEPINRDFVRRVFSDDTGTLYEGTLSDFSADWRGTFEKETHLESAETPLIDALTLALEAPDGELLASLESTLDLQQFYLYWAAEVLTNHWDGYANNANNFYLYDTGIGDLSFIVSGPDGALQEGNPFPAGPAAPRSVFATSRLVRRLYLLAESRDAFRARLSDVLGQWDSSAVLSEIDRLESLLAPYGAAPTPSDVEEVRQFIAGREAALAVELGGAPPPWPYPEREPPCFSPLGTLTGSFESEYGTLQDNPVTTGEGDLEVTLGGAPLALGPGGAVVGSDGPKRASMYVTGLRADGDVELLALRLERPVVPGSPSSSTSSVTLACSASTTLGPKPSRRPATSTAPSNSASSRRRPALPWWGRSRATSSSAASDRYVLGAGEALSETTVKRPSVKRLGVGAASLLRRKHVHPASERPRQAERQEREPRVDVEPPLGREHMRVERRRLRRNKGSQT